MSNFPAFYEHNRGDTPYNSIYGGLKKEYLFQALDRWKGKDFTCQTIWKGGSISAIVVNAISEESGFHMIAMIAAMAELFFLSDRSNQGDRSDRSDHMENRL